MSKYSKAYWINLLTLFFKVGFFVLLAVAALFLALQIRWEDFRSFYSAALLVRRGGNPYDYGQLAPVLEEVTGAQSNSAYYNPPWFALLFVPLTLLPYMVAKVIWYLVNALLFGVSLELLRKAIDLKIAPVKRWGLYFVSILAFGFYCLQSGQAGIFVLFGLALVLSASQKERYSLAGLGLVMMVTKPQMTFFVLLVLAVWLLFHQPRTILWAAGWGVGLLTISSILMPAWWHFDKASFGKGIQVMQGAGAGGSLRVHSTAFDFAEYVLGVPEQFTFLFWGVMALLGGWLVYIIYRHYRKFIPLTAVSVLYTFVITPYTLQYDYVLLVVPVFWMVQQLPHVKVKFRYSVIGLLLFAFSVYFWQTWSYECYWQVIAVMLAFGLLVVGLRQAPQTEAVSG